MAQEASGLGARLKRLPGQFLLALINATALLVIAACILVIVVLNRVDRAGAEIANSVTEAALTQLDMTPSELKTRLQTIGDSVEKLAGELENPTLGEDRELTRQLNELNRNLNDLKSAAKEIGAAGPKVTDAAFRQAGTMLTDALFAVRGCTADRPSGSPGS